MNEEKIMATGDLEYVKSAIKRNPQHDAVVINLRVFNRLMEHYPNLFEKKGMAIIFEGNNHVYFHNGEDNEIRTKKADRSIESK